MLLWNANVTHPLQNRKIHCNEQNAGKHFVWDQPLFLQNSTWTIGAAARLNAPIWRPHKMLLVQISSQTSRQSVEGGAQCNLELVKSELVGRKSKQKSSFSSVCTNSFDCLDYSICMNIWPQTAGTLTVCVEWNQSYSI